MNPYQGITVGFYFGLVIFWIALFISGSTAGFYNYFYSFLFGLTPLLGGLVAMYHSRRWGSFRSAVGKAVFFIGFGVFLWGVGEMIWSFYNFVLNVPAPYPSLADLGFSPSIFFYGLGAIYLSKATGAKVAMRSNLAKGFVIVAPIIVAAVSYYLLITVARGGVISLDSENVIKSILDVAYPLGSFIALLVAVLIAGLSFKYLGGRYRNDVFAIWAGLFVMFVADTMFSYTTTIGTYYNGNFGDLLLTTGTTLLTYGVLGFATSRSIE